MTNLDTLKMRRSSLSEKLAGASEDERMAIIKQIDEIEISIATEKISVFEEQLLKALNVNDSEKIKRCLEGVEIISKERDVLLQDFQKKYNNEDQEDLMEHVAEAEKKDSILDLVNEPLKVIEPKKELLEIVDSIKKEIGSKREFEDIDDAIKFLRENEAKIPKKNAVEPEKIKQYQTADQDLKKAEKDQRENFMKGDPAGIFERAIKVQEKKLEMLDAKFGATADKEQRLKLTEEMQTEAKLLRSYQGQQRVFQLTYNDDGSRRIWPDKQKQNDVETKKNDIETNKKDTETKKSDTETAEKKKDKPSGVGEKVTSSEVSQAKYVLHKYHSPVSKVLHYSEIKEAVTTLAEHKIESFEKKEKLKGESVQMTGADSKIFQKMVKQEEAGMNKLERLEATSSFYKKFAEKDYIKEYNRAIKDVEKAQMVQKNILERSVAPDLVLVAVKDQATIVDTGSKQKLEKVAKEMEPEVGVKYQVMSKAEAEKLGEKSTEKPGKKEEVQKETESARARVKV